MTSMSLVQSRRERASANLALLRLGECPLPLEVGDLERVSRGAGLFRVSEIAFIRKQLKGNSRANLLTTSLRGMAPTEACELWSGHMAGAGVGRDPPKFPWRPWQPGSPGCCSMLGPGVMDSWSDLCIISAGGQGARGGSVHSFANMS